MLTKRSTVIIMLYLHERDILQIKYETILTGTQILHFSKFNSELWDIEKKNRLINTDRGYQGANPLFLWNGDTYRHSTPIMN